MNNYNQPSPKKHNREAVRAEAPELDLMSAQSADNDSDFDCDSDMSDNEE